MTVLRTRRRVGRKSCSTTESAVQFKSIRSSRRPSSPYIEPPTHEFPSQIGGAQQRANAINTIFGYWEIFRRRKIQADEK